MSLFSADRTWFIRVVLLWVMIWLAPNPVVGQPAPGAGDLHQALLLARQDRAHEPTARSGFDRLAREFGTPLYIYDRALIEHQALTLKEAFQTAFPKLRIFYAAKANTSLALMSLLRAQGFGIEVISGGEILTANEIGVSGDDLMFSSSSKSPWEIDLALEQGAIINIDSLDELGQVEVAAARRGTTARISFRINPGVDPHTIHQINTGKAESKFGLHLDGGLALTGYRRATKLSRVRVVGLHCHIGSQITTTEGYQLTARKILAFALELKQKLGLHLEFINLGGGIGIPYHDGQVVMTPADLAGALQPIWQEGVARLGYEPTLWIEPGRYFVAPAGFLLTRVNSVKKTPIKTFINVDAGFNTLARPAMYQAYHRVRIIGRREPLIKADIAGNVCETGDILAVDRLLPRPVAGDLAVILDAGAYGFSMASEYNSRPLPAEVLVDGDTVSVIRGGGTISDLFRRQQVPVRGNRN